MNALARERSVAWLAFVIYVGVIIGANWMISHVGSDIGGTHYLPVGFGLLAPSGVYLAAVAFIARDVLQRLRGTKIGVVAIIVGALLSGFASTAHLAVASGATFLLSESTDFAIFTPLQRWNFPIAVLLAGVVGDVVDSVVFLTLAGIPLSIALPGQLLGKLWVMIAGALIAWWLRHYRMFQQVNVAVSGCN
ncbi:MAG: VUT family protein [Ferrimicrobium sp.]